MGKDDEVPWNPEHLEILKQGVDVWNAWRADNPTIRPDFSGADLKRAELSGADLSEADLSEAKLVLAKLLGTNLGGANLNGASLGGAQLDGAYLGGARLNGANLSATNLIAADLSDADLSQTDLSDADLRGAKLRKTDFSRSKLGGVDLRDADLVETEFEGATMAYVSFLSTSLGRAKGLDKVEHYGPSSIGPYTLEACGLELPDAFLKGIGYKDWEILSFKLRNPDLRPDQVIDITYRIADMRTKSPIQTNSIFFSYSSQDAPFVEAIEKRFNEDHINSWRDVHEISAGPIEAQLERAINLNGTVLLVLSKNSVHSEWVKYEVRKARKLQAKLEEENQKQMHVLCPVALDNSWESCPWPARIREDLLDYHIMDCSDWKKPSFDEKYEKLKKNLGLYYFGQNRKQGARV